MPTACAAGVCRTRWRRIPSRGLALGGSDVLRKVEPGWVAQSPHSSPGVVGRSGSRRFPRRVKTLWFWQCVEPKACRTSDDSDTTWNRDHCGNSVHEIVALRPPRFKGGAAPGQHVTPPYGYFQDGGEPNYTENTTT